MKTLLGILTSLCSAVSLSAALGVGDTYQQVIKEKGQPGGKMEGGGMLILQYPDETVKLRDGRVVSIDASVRRSGGAVAAPAAPAPASRSVDSIPAKEASNERVTWTTD